MFDKNISIPFPLSDGGFARLYMPHDMTISDAKRLKRVINALYINQKKNAVEPKSLARVSSDSIT